MGLPGSAAVGPGPKKLKFTPQGRRQGHERALDGSGKAMVSVRRRCQGQFDPGAKGEMELGWLTVGTAKEGSEKSLAWAGAAGHFLPGSDRPRGERMGSLAVVE